MLVVEPSVLKHVPEVISFFILKSYAAYILKTIKKHNTVDAKKKKKITCQMHSEEKDEKRREAVYLIWCQPQIKLRVPFKELNY